MQTTNTRIIGFRLTTIQREQVARVLARLQLGFGGSYAAIEQNNGYCKVCIELGEGSAVKEFYFESRAVMLAVLITLDRYTTGELTSFDSLTL